MSPSSFQSSILFRSRLVQSDEDYSYEIGNLGEVTVITEVGSGDSSGDEASGTEQRKNSVQNRVFGVNKLRDVWREPMALAVALDNMGKVSGCKVNAVLNCRGQEEDYVKELLNMVDKEVRVETKNEQCLMYALRNIYKFIEIHQSQYYE